MGITTGKVARRRGGNRAAIKRAWRQSNPSSYPVKFPNEQNEEARKRYRSQKNK